MKTLGVVIGLLSIPLVAHGQVTETVIRSNEVIYSPSQGKLYLSVPGSWPKIGNTITELDPLTLEVGNSVAAGSEPMQLTMSDSGNTLYTGLRGTPQVTQVDLTDFSFVRTFPLGTASQFVEGFDVQPGTENVLAVARRNYQFSPHIEAIAIYEDGVARPQITASGCYIAFADNPTRLYGLETHLSSYGFFRMDVDENGVTRISENGGLFTHSNIQITQAGGRVYGTNGVVIDPEQLMILGTFIGGGRMVPDLFAGRAFHLNIQSGVATIKSFDINSFALVETREFPAIQGGYGTFVRWGKHGFAFNTDADKVYSIQSSIAWKPLIVPPTSLNVVRGTVVSGNLNSITTSNEQRLILRPGVVFSTQIPPIEFEVSATAPGLSFEDISFMLESQTTSPNIRQTISLYDFDAGVWEQVSVKSTTTTDARTYVDKIGDGNRFIEPVTGTIRARVTFRATGPLLAYPWEARIDTARWTFPQ